MVGGEEMYQRFITEFFQYNDYITLITILVPWFIGAGVILDIAWRNIVIRYWNNLWRGMDKEVRYEITTLTFTTKKW